MFELLQRMTSYLAICQPDILLEYLRGFDDRLLSHLLLQDKESHLCTYKVECYVSTTDDVEVKQRVCLRRSTKRILLKLTHFAFTAGALTV